MTFYQRQIIEQAQLPYSPLAKAFEKTKQNKKQVGAMKSLDLYNILKQTEGIFSQNLMNDLIH